MKITFAVIGKTTEEYLKTGQKIFLDRLKHYVKIDVVEITQVKKPGKINPIEQKRDEAKQLFKFIDKYEYIVLLDERGKQLKSGEFAGQIQRYMNMGLKSILFVAGGPYGFDQKVVDKAHLKISLSKMTFSHQMVRLFFLEQLYRAFTIIRGEKYHNE